MTECLSPEERARQEAASAILAAILRMARAAGTEIQERPAWPGAASTIRYADPAAGIRFARILGDAARHCEHGYVQYARETGLTWEQVGAALSLEADHGRSPGEAAFEHVTDAEHARPFADLAFHWTCPACSQGVSDRGPYNGHPADCERGHADGCSRLAAAIAEYKAQWGDE